VALSEGGKALFSVLDLGHFIPLFSVGERIPTLAGGVKWATPFIRHREKSAPLSVYLVLEIRLPGIDKYVLNMHIYAYENDH
jgi:hypothetical protein